MKKIEYRSVWEKRKEEEKKRIELAIEKARIIARYLKDKYHVKETILFGSLIWRPHFSWHGTDIDLMVKGLRPKKYFETLSEVYPLASPFTVDLIPFEKANPLIKRRALKEGLRLE